MWQGIFTRKNNNGCVSLSSLVCIDIDHQPEMVLDQIKNTISGWPFVLAFYRSPSGDGLKVIVRTDNYSIADYGNCYRQVEKLFVDAFMVEPDKHCEDLSHPCFVSYDPDLYYNPDAEPWHYEYKPEFEKTVPTPLLDAYREYFKPTPPPKPLTDQEKYLMRLKQELAPLSDTQIIMILDLKWSKFPDNYLDGNRTKSIFIQACTLCKAGIFKNDAMKYLKRRFLNTGYNEGKLEYEVNRAYEKNKHLFGEERGIYKPYYLYKQRH